VEAIGRSGIFSYAYSRFGYPDRLRIIGVVSFVSGVGAFKRHGSRVGCGLRKLDGSGMGGRPPILVMEEGQISVSLSLATYLLLDKALLYPRVATESAGIL
jgi:hypothetical protein